MTDAEKLEAWRGYYQRRLDIMSRTTDLFSETLRMQGKVAGLTEAISIIKGQQEPSTPPEKEVDGGL